MRTATLAFLPLLSGCVLFPEFAALQERLDGLMNPLMAQGLVIGVDEPQDEALDPFLELAGMEPGTSATLFLADAEQASTASDAPVVGASVYIDGVRALESEEGGTYAVDPLGGLWYDEGARWHVDIDRFSDDSELSSVAIRLPQVVEVDIPQHHTPWGEMRLDLEGQGFTAVIVVVMSTYGVTHDSQPQTVDELVVFTKSTQELASYVIPGEAFADEGAYTVGVAGLHPNDASTIVNLNTFASTVMAGKMRFYPVSVWTEPPTYP